MGKSKSGVSGSQKGQFQGVGLQKSSRRGNKFGGSPRLMYPYVTKDQRGTPMEGMVKAQYPELIQQYNAKHSAPGQMEQGEAAHQLANIWWGVNKSMQGVKSVKDYQKKNGGSRRSALNALIGMGMVNFGADPKSR